MQTFFSTPLPAGQTSRSFALPGTGSEDQSSRSYLVTVTRDAGSPDVNSDLVVEVRQGSAGTVLLRDTYVGASSQALFVAAAGDGTVTLVNLSVEGATCVSISDLDVR